MHKIKILHTNYLLNSPQKIKLYPHSNIVGKTVGGCTRKRVSTKELLSCIRGTGY